jgi:membrane protease YdiL (CAAX protease family)
MLKSERIVGAAYLPVHIFLLPWLFANTNVLSQMNIALSGPSVNLIYFVISFVFILIFLFRYLKASFFALLDNLLGSLKYIVLAYMLNYLFITLVSVILSFILQDASNPNTQEIINQTKLDKDVMIFIAVLLAPIVEETLFRGVLFGTIRNKSRVTAYIVSALVFSVYHLWQYFVGGFEWSLLLYLLQYIPASVALCWCYEKSGTIWSPIVLHAAINLISIKVTFG